MGLITTPRNNGPFLSPRIRDVCGMSLGLWKRGATFVISDYCHVCGPGACEIKNGNTLSATLRPDLPSFLLLEFSCLTQETEPPTLCSTQTPFTLIFDPPHTPVTTRRLLVLRLKLFWFLSPLCSPLLTSTLQTWIHEILNRKSTETQYDL